MQDQTAIPAAIRAAAEAAGATIERTAEYGGPGTGIPAYRVAIARTRPGKATDTADEIAIASGHRIRAWKIADDQHGRNRIAIEIAE